MLIIYIYIIFIAKGIVAQNCQLAANNIYPNWFYTIKPTPQTWDVLHTDFVQDQTSLYLICKDNSQIFEMRCNRGNLLVPKITSCAKPLKSTTVLKQNATSFCKDMGGTVYQAQFTLPDGSIIQLYEVCYNVDMERALYTRHKSYHFALSIINTSNTPTFLKGNVVSSACMKSYTTENIFATFGRLLGNQNYIHNKSHQVIDRGHLVNAQDFLTNIQKAATYKYDNLIPQFRGSNRFNWKRIENWIRRLVIRGKYAEVVTGSFGILSLPSSDPPHADVPMYLMANNKNPIPLWTYKVVKYDNKCYAFVTLNNDFNINAQITTSNCKSVTCHEDLVFNNTMVNGISYCCNYYHFARNVGSHVSLCPTGKRLRGN